MGTSVTLGAKAALVIVHFWVLLANGQEVSILFQRQQDSNIYSINPDGSDLRKVAEGRDPVRSPDGQSLVVRQGRNVVIYSSEGTVFASLGEGFGHTWSPDGQQVVFQGPKGITIVNKDGSGERALSAEGRSPHWSPSSPSMIYCNVERPTSIDAIDLYRISIDTGVSERVLEYTHIPDIRQPFSPDGTRLFVSDCLDGSSCVKVLTLATGELVQIGPEGRVGAQRPAWSPDGTHIAFELFDGMGGLHLADAQGQTTIELVPGRSEAAPSGASWSPNGNMIVFHMMNFATATPGPQLYLVNADGTDLRQLTEGWWPIWTSRLSRDGGDNTSTRDISWGIIKSQRSRE